MFNRIPGKAQLLLKFVLFLSLFGTYVHADTRAAKIFDPVTMDLRKVDEQYPPNFSEVFIPFSDGQLTGFILGANGRGPHPTFVLLHGLPGNEKNLDLAQSLRRAGFNVLFFHYRGAWGSEGKYSFLTLHQDALSAIEFLKKNAKRYRVDTQRLSIVGHSFGGYAALRSGNESSDLKCVVALSAANPAAYSERKNGLDGIAGYVDSLFMLDGFSGAQARQELQKHATEMDTRLFASGLKNKQVYLLVGKSDKVTPPVLQRQLVDSYSLGKNIDLTAEEIAGDHAFSNSRILMQQKVVRWSQRHCF